MDVSLVIMAAGLGSRYGGSKQVDGIGPHNEILMEYSIYDALRAGFNKIVFIIKPEMEEMMRRICGDYLERKTARDGSPVQVVYAVQDFTSVPDFYQIPEGRTKPFGTVHALLCAADAVHEPCCVINADDYYGSLVIMAAGLGSRYGGSKQVDGIGPHNEILMEYSIYDALRAGFNKIVFIIKPEMEEMMRRICGDYLERKTARDGSPVQVVYAVQDFTSVPDFYQIPEGRTKPFGTVHALLCAADAVHEPCCVINADDYYGIDAYRTIYQELVHMPPQGRATMVGYLLKNTASLHGTVSRGVCSVENGHLADVREALKVQLYPDGTLRDLAEDRSLAPDTVVSMNFWGFAPSIFPELRKYFEDFLRHEAGQDLKAECLLPVMVGQQVKAGQLEVSVLHSADKWFGMTYREDREVVSQALRRLHESGAYPEDLRK